MIKPTIFDNYPPSIMIMFTFIDTFSVLDTIVRLYRSTLRMIEARTSNYSKLKSVSYDYSALDTSALRSDHPTDRWQVSPKFKAFDHFSPRADWNAWSLAERSSRSIDRLAVSRLNVLHVTERTVLVVARR